MKQLVYGTSHSTASGGAVVATTALPFTGLSVLWIAVLALTMLSVAFAVMRLLPKQTE